LLRSNIANGSDAVGRYLMDHPIRQSLALVPGKLYPFRGPQTTSQFETFRDGEFRSKYAAFKTSLKNDGWSSSGWPRGPMTPTGVKSDKYPGTIVDLVETWGFIGKGLREKLEDHGTRQLMLNSACEQLPLKDNRITLSSKRDVLDLERPLIEYRLKNDEYVINCFRKIVKFHDFVFASLGAPPDQRYFVDDKSIPEEKFNYGGSGHIMGTTRMGNDPHDSVVDRNCRSHEHRNLFILGSSVFPTSSTANPTSTIAALALRAATFISDPRNKKDVFGV